jgi:glycine amidinotransferase
MQDVSDTGRACGVSFEYGALREVIVGRPEGFRIPKLTAAAIAEYAQFLPAIDLDFIVNGQGRTLVDYAPDVAAELAAQVEHLVDLLEERAVTVHRPRPLTAAEELFPGPGFEGGSLFFMRDPILVIGHYIIDLAMRFPFRRRQRFALREIIERKVAQSGMHFISMPEPVPVPVQDGFGPSAFLEGGDVLLNGRDIYVGVSGHASTVGGAQWLRRTLGTLGTLASVHIIKLGDDALHLDVVLSLPRPGLAIACLDALPDGLPGSLRDWDVIDVPLDSAKRLACNGLVLDENTYIMDRAHGAVADQLTKRGVNVIAIPFHLPARFGGGLRCAHHPLSRVR